jgi:hypothetical protein
MNTKKNIRVLLNVHVCGIVPREGRLRNDHSMVVSDQGQQICQGMRSQLDL